MDRNLWSQYPQQHTGGNQDQNQHDDAKAYQQDWDQLIKEN